MFRASRHLTEQGLQIQADHVATVIGASGSIGSQLSATLLKSGCRVAAVARRQGRLELVRQSLTSTGRIEIFPFDIVVEDAVRAGLTEIKSRMGRIDYLVYAAGIQPDQDTPLAQYTTQAWLETLGVYCTGFSWPSGKSFPSSTKGVISWR